MTDAQVAANFVLLLSFAGAAFYLGFRADPAVPVWKDLGFYLSIVMGALFALLVAGAVGCATTPPLREDSTPPERCVEVVSVMCRRVADCNLVGYNQCLAEQVPVCAGMVRLPLEPARSCAEAVRSMPCDGTMPVECFAIGEYEER